MIYMKYLKFSIHIEDDINIYTNLIKLLHDNGMNYRAKSYLNSSDTLKNGTIEYRINILKLTSKQVDVLKTYVMQHDVDHILFS